MLDTTQSKIPFNMKYLLFISVLALSFSCKKKSINCGLDCDNQNEELIFQTGFTGTSMENGEYQNVNFSGNDPNLSEKSDWEAFKTNGKIGYVEIGYEDGDDTQRLASITDDPDSVGNKVLKYQLFEPHIKEGANRKGRAQLSVHDNNCIKEIHHKVKLKLHPDLAFFKERDEKLAWFTLFEIWNNGAWTKEKYPFRVTVNLFKEEGAANDINFRVKSDFQKCSTCKWEEVWGETQTDFPVRFGEWMELEIYLKEGDDNSGRFYMSVTPKGESKIVLFDISNTTQHPKEKCADGFTHFEAMKIYTSEENINYMNDAGKELAIYWDDWELHLNKQP
jgi:hypothetical protein